MSDRRGLVAAIVAITVLKAVAVLLFFPDTIVWEDGEGAENLLRHGSFFIHRSGVDNHTLQFPVYGFLVAAVYRLVGIHPPAAALLNLLLNAATAWVLALVVERLIRHLDVTGRLVRLAPFIVLATVLAFLLHPIASYYAMNMVHPLTMDMLMFYALILATLLYFERGCRRRELLLLGLMTGLVLLDRTVLGAALTLFLILGVRRFGWRPTIARALIAVGIGLLVGVPWLVRNYRWDGIVGYTSTTGEILWKGALADSEGSNYLTNGQPYRSVLSDEELGAVTAMTVRQQNRYFMNRYLDIARTEPAVVLRLYARKLQNFFWFRPNIGNEYSRAMRRLIPLYTIGYATMLALALLSIPVFGRASLLPWSPVVALGLVQAVFYVETRHRVVIEPLLAMLAVASVMTVAYDRLPQCQTLSPRAPSLSPSRSRGKPAVGKDESRPHPTTSPV